MKLTKKHKRMIIKALEKTIKLWDTKTGEEIQDEDCCLCSVAEKIQSEFTDKDIYVNDCEDICPLPVYCSALVFPTYSYRMGFNDDKTGRLVRKEVVKYLTKVLNTKKKEFGL